MYNQTAQRLLSISVITSVLGMLLLSNSGTAFAQHKEPVLDPERAAAVARYDTERFALLKQAREQMRLKNFAGAAQLYKQAYNLKPVEVDGGTKIAPPAWYKPHPAYFMQGGEWGEALYASGKLQEALAAYQLCVYQKITLSNCKSPAELAPIAVLPGAMQDLDAARQQFPHYYVDAWACNQSSVLARYALLLAEAGKYAEALPVYQYGLSNLAAEEYKPALDLSDLSAANFDRKRFLAAAHVLFAKDFESQLWYEYRDYKKLDDLDEDELKMALGIKPDYAPALIAIADLIRNSAEPVSQERKQFAKDCLIQAATSAPTAAQKELATQKYAKYGEKL